MIYLKMLQKFSVNTSLLYLLQFFFFKPFKSTRFLSFNPNLFEVKTWPLRYLWWLNKGSKKMEVN